MLSQPNFEESFGFTKIIIKTFYSCFFIFAGYIYKQSFEKRIKFDTKTIGIVFILNTIIILLFHKHYYIDINKAKFYHNISPFIVPFIGIYFTLFISKFLALIVKEGSLIDKIGKNTLHIMANHIFIIFLIELIIFNIDGHQMDGLPKYRLNNFFYNMTKYKYLYTFLSIIICTYIGEGLSSTGKFIKSKFGKRSTEAPCVQSDDVQALPLR